MSSKFDFVARVRSEGKVTIPSELREQLNLQQGEFLEISIRKPQWYELLDWSQMSCTTINFNALSPDAQNYISTNYTCDNGGNSWRSENA